MFIKFFLLSGLLLVCYGFVVILLRRLTHVRNQLVSLHEQMARNDAQLHAQMQRLSELQQAQAASASMGTGAAETVSAEANPNAGKQKF